MSLLNRLSKVLRASLRAVCNANAMVLGEAKQLLQEHTGGTNMWFQAHGLFNQDITLMFEMAKTEVVKFYHELIGTQFVIIDLPLKPLM